MPGHRNTLRLLLAVIALVTLNSAAEAQSSAVLFRNIRVFDGARTLSNRDVLVIGDRIEKLGRSLTTPAGAQVFDGTGKTLLPGLIDAHVHVRPGAAESAIVFGVTTELDMFTDVAFAKKLHAEQSAGTAKARADVLSAGTLVTAPKGHGTEYGLPIPTITLPGDARAFVEARVAEGSDYIKLVYDDGHRYGLDLPTLSKETMTSVIAAAHTMHKLAVVHIGTLAGARDAIEAGADGLAHLFVDQSPDPELGTFVARHHAFVVPTLSVLAVLAREPRGPALAKDPRLAPFLSRADVTILEQSFPPRLGVPPSSYSAAVDAVRGLKKAGVPMLAGTDAGNPGTLHGASLHGELELLVHAGLTPGEALAAATSVPARIFGLADRGRIAPGMRADMVLVAGDPTVDITTTRAIEGVWKAGVPIDRAAYAAAIAEANEAATRAPRGSESGLVSDFDAGTTSASFGAGWVVTTDAMANGKSDARMTVVDGGAAGSPKALEITGTISPAIAGAWAGAMFSPGVQMMTPANLSSKKAIHFWAKGDGKTYRLLVFAESRGFTPFVQTFVADVEWKEYVVPFSAFGGMDGHDLRAIIFAGGPTPGAFSFRIDDVRFR